MGELLTKMSTDELMRMLELLDMLESKSPMQASDREMDTMQWPWNLENWPANPWMDAGMTRERLNEIYWIYNHPSESLEGIQERAHRSYASGAKHRQTEGQMGAGGIIPKT